MHQMTFSSFLLKRVLFFFLLSTRRLWIAIIGGGVAISCFFLLIQSIVGKCLDPKTRPQVTCCSKQLLRKQQSNLMSRVKRQRGRRPQAAGHDSVELEGIEGKYRTFENPDQPEVRQ